jgi:hypothetical protein
MNNPQVATDKLEPDKVIELARILFEHIEGQIKAADSKAWLELGANTLLANLLNTLIENLTKSLYVKDAGSALLVLSRLGAQATWNQNLTALLALLMFVSILISLGYAFWTVKPVLGGHGAATGNSKPVKNMFYFSDIHALAPAEFIRTFQNQSRTEIAEALLTQVYIKAAIADRKFALLNRSTVAMIAALGCWAVAQLTLILR